MPAWTVRVLLAALVVSLARGAGAMPLGHGEQSCVNAMNAAGLAVARAQAALTDACFAGTGDVPACVANDADADLAAAVQHTFDAALASCAEPPAFGVDPTLDQNVNDAAVTHVRRLVDDAFGSSPAGAIIADPSDTKGRRCQAAVVKGMEAIVVGYVARFARCVEKALEKGAGDSAALASCNGVTAIKGTATKARKKLVAQARRRCRDASIGTVFQGRCVGEGSPARAARCLGTRAVCRACRIANAMDGLDTDCDLVDDGVDDDSCTLFVTLSGDAIPFDRSPDGRIEGADVSLLEHPERHVMTGADGHFVFDGLEEGSEATVVMTHPDYHPIQTGTIKLGPKGVDHVTFQAVIYPIWDALAALLQVVPDDANRCQMVTTVTRVGKSIYTPGAHGEDAVTVTLDPPLPAEHGPIYFNSSVVPDRSLVQTSDDGGVLFIQVAPGDYTWTAHKTGAAFSRVKMKCRAGYLVNASPPKGLQRH